jgi:hypothetical protein
MAGKRHEANFASQDKNKTQISAMESVMIAGNGRLIGTTVRTFRKLCSKTAD